ncbi:MAG: YitT family protein [Bacteroidales bacterium]|nr:YitT family protein [Bacteroidales bacterium]
MEISSRRISRLTILNEIHDYLYIFVGMALYGLGWTIFLLPNNIMTGGVPGISSLVYFATGLHVQYVYFFINFILLLLSIWQLGWKFSIKTVFAVSVLTIIISLQQEMFHGFTILNDQPFMACIIGASLCGTGVGIAFSANGSTGGIDIIAAIINKYRDVSLGRVIMLTDIIIISCSYFLFRDIEKLIYGYSNLFIMTSVLDYVVNSARRSVQFFIISNKHEIIGKLINQEVKRGVTIIDGTGFFTGQKVHMLFVLAKRRESPRIFRLIKEADPHAFVSQSAVIGVYGEGFDHIKGK